MTSKYYIPKCFVKGLKEKTKKTLKLETKGWKQPPNIVYVQHNPFNSRRHAANADVIAVEI